MCKVTLAIPFSQMTIEMDIVRQIEVLNLLSGTLNIEYGYKEGIPRINLGPCGRFVKTFRELWNERFDEGITVCFLVSPETRACHHCFIKFPHSFYFDGGNGVVREADVSGMIPASMVIDEMEGYDEKILERNAYGFNRNYPDCSGYNDHKVRQIVARHLSLI